MALKVETYISKDTLQVILNDGYREVVHKFLIIEETNRMLAVDWVTERSFASVIIKDNMAIMCAVLAKLGKQYVKEYDAMVKEQEREAKEIILNKDKVHEAIEF